MLFNMSRSPFTRTQRAAALEWARKLGATNVPTLESFDEFERRIEVGHERTADENDSVHNSEYEKACCWSIGIETGNIVKRE